MEGQSGSLPKTGAVVFQFGSYSLSDYTAEFNPVHIQSDEEVVHHTRAGKTQRLAEFVKLVGAADRWGETKSSL